MKQFSILIFGTIIAIILSDAPLAVVVDLAKWGVVSGLIVLAAYAAGIWIKVKVMALGQTLNRPTTIVTSSTDNSDPQ